MAVDAGSIFSEVRIALDKLNNDIKKAKTAFDKFGKENEKDSKEFEKDWENAYEGFSVVGLAAIGVVSAAFASAVKTFANTEQAMANVRAVTNSTEEEFQKLKTAAEDAGETTRFNAEEAANALFFLASAGLDATESVEALDGVLLLAGATGSDLAQSAQTVTATLSQFNLTTEESIDVVNVFAAANSNSQATLTRLQNSLRQVGPVAGALNKSLEETVGVLQVLFNAGFEGETAGRALKNALADLGNESSIANKKLSDLGISFETVNPATNDLASVFGTLAEAGLETSEVLDVFGTVAGPAVLQLIQAGRGEIERYTTAVTDTNEAARQYAVQNDTLSGSFDKFKSNVQTTGNSLVEQLAPAFRVALDVGSQILKIFNLLPGELKGAATGLGIAAGGVFALTNALKILDVTLSAPLGPIALIGGVIGLASSVAIRFRAIRNERLADEFGDIAREAGAVGSEFDDLVIAAGRIERNLRQVAAVEVSDNLQTAKDTIEGILDEYDLTLETLQKIADTSDDLNDRQRELIGLAIDLKKEERDRAERAAFYLEQQEAIASVQEGALEVQQEAQKLDDLANDSVLDSIDLFQRKIRLREEEIDRLQDLAEAGLVANDVIAAAIEDQRFKVEQYESALDDLARTTQDNAIESARATQEEIDRRKTLTELIEDQATKERELFLLGLEEKSIKLREAGAEEIEINQFVENEITRFDAEKEAERTQIREEEAARKKELRDEEAAEIRDLQREQFEESVRIRNENIDAEKRANEEILEDRKRTQQEWINFAEATSRALFDTLIELNRIESEETLEAFDERTQASLDNANSRIEDIKRANDAAREAFDTETQALLDNLDKQTIATLEANGLLEETKIQRLERELQEAIDKGDEENQAELEKQIQRENIISAAEAERDRILEERAEAEKIAEEQRITDLQNAEENKLEIEKEAAAERRQLEFQAELEAWNLKKKALFADTAVGIIKTFAQFGFTPAGAIAAAGLGIASTFQFAQLQANKPKLETGGIILPRSGGVETIQAENGFPELSLNAGPSGLPLLRDFARLINQEGGGQRGDISITIPINLDGREVARSSATYYNNGQVRLDT